MTKKELRIVLTGGGSGGHVYPLLAVAEKLEKTAIEKKIYAELRYFGPADNYKNVIENAGVKCSPIISGKLRRYFSLLNILDIPKSFIGFFQALFKIFLFMPDAVFSKGGTGAFPVVFAAWFHRIPVIIHESDARPGLNNLLSARFAKRIAVSFEYAQNYFNPKKTAWVGTPVRTSLLGGKPAKEQAKEELGFASDQPLILILGGSQGAQRINELIILDLKDLMEITQILHQTGTSNFSEVRELSRTALLDVAVKTELKNRYQATPYLEDNMKTALSAADLVIARAGSNAIFEIAAFSKPSILIPLAESANDHQRANAYEFAKGGAAIVIEETNLLPGIFLGQIRETLKNPELLAKMSLASERFFKPRAAEVIAEEILRVAGL
ncbi:MAG: UDP-N-acetylglucosamine--N-acetylmuramyl-(pentapeptide) pyrophosphoryl-undecaprenol N-acetylglucosamine transferase [Candidatus Liptonbacteria bacterium]|nr:UDP-N-acetylglucosamine--N-acetylmuramyl-(pentapeptide) pyrophosphoryl-undecaprenol N-acetylglucosamine transferase [Candidatus Liptonbacteria bacterium]